MNFLQDQFAHNQVLTGVVGGGAVAYALAQVRNLPRQIWGVFLDQFTVHLTVHGEDSFGPFLDYYLSSHEWIERSRKLGVHVIWPKDDDNEDDYPRSSRRKRPEFRLTAGPGSHLIRFMGKFIFVKRMEEKQEGTYTRLVTMQLRAFGRDKSIFNELIQACELAQIADKRIPVFVWGSLRAGSYELAGRRQGRKLETVFMDRVLKAEMVSDLTDFLGKEEWYRDHGIPYRRGYLFSGDPGTGKSTLIFALASHLEKPLYIINPASLQNDEALERAFREAGDGIVVIEDLDAIETSSKRTGPKKDEPEKGKISLSGLLNAVDGLSAKDGRILIVTTNHPENLDPALIRPGRIDKQARLAPLSDNDLAISMCQHFLGPDDGRDYFFMAVKSQLPITPAVLQNKLLAELSDVSDHDDLHQPNEPPSPIGEGADDGQIFTRPLAEVRDDPDRLAAH